MSFYVYMLECADGSYYVGHTDGLEKRIAAHEQGTIPGYTARRRPFSVVFVQDFETRTDAYERERQVKGWSRAKKKALIDGDWASLIKLARSSGSTSSP